MAETLKYCIPRMQAYAELLYSMNAVTRHGLIIPFSTSARCVFVRQTTVCPTKTLAPKGGLNHSKVVIRQQTKQVKIMPKLEIANNNRYGHRRIEEVPRWDRWDTRMPDVKDQLRAIDLYNKSGAVSKSDFVRARILGERFKVIMVDKSAVEYYRKLSELTAQVHKIGINYNQVVRLMHLYTAEKSVKALLQELIQLTKELTTFQEKAVSLTIDYRER